LVLTGERAAAVLASRPLKVGDSIRVGEENGWTADGLVEELHQASLVLSLSQWRSGIISPPTSVILAIPRPQILKQALRSCGMFGVERVMLVRAQECDKSYFQSTVLREENLSQHLRDGMEQSTVTRTPQVSQHLRFRPFLEDDLENLLPAGSLRLLPDPRGVEHLAQQALPCGISLDRPVVVAIGPEAGWSDFERELFVSRGFELFNVGAPILRVDVALIALLAQIDLLRNVNLVNGLSTVQEQL